MKTTPQRAVALLALAGAAFAPAVHAAPSATTYTTGDLLLGFTQAGNSADLLVDIGPASQYLNNSQSFAVNFGFLPGTSTPVTNLAADLTAVFGNNWANNTGAGLVQWGLVGVTDHFNDGTFGLPANTLFLSKGETTYGTQTTPLNRFRSGPSSTIGGTINGSLDLGIGGYNGSNSTSNSSVATVQQIGSDANAYANFNPSTNAFGTGYNIQQPVSGPSGPTNSQLDLYTLQPATNNTSPGSYDGSFVLGTDGGLTYSPVPLAAVPEPSAFWMVGIAAVFHLTTYRLRRRAA